MHNLVRPKFFIPVHGEYHHLVQHAKLAQELGMAKDHVFLGENGYVFEFTKDKGQVAGKVTAGMVMVDGLGVGDIGNSVLNERKVLSVSGLIVLAAAFDA